MEDMYTSNRAQLASGIVSKSNRKIYKQQSISHIKMKSKPNRLIDVVMNTTGTKIKCLFKGKDIRKRLECYYYYYS